LCIQEIRRTVMRGIGETAIVALPAFVKDVHSGVRANCSFILRLCVASGIELKAVYVNGSIACATAS
jgi:hypothetical protein